MLPLAIMNKITKYISEMNNDDFIIKFCEVGKMNKNTKRLCTCCKRRITMFFVLNKQKFEPKLINHFNIKKTHIKQLVCVDTFCNDGDMICIKSKTITTPGLLGQDDEIKVYNTYVISYTTQYFKSEYIVLTDVCVNIYGKKSCLDGIIVNSNSPKKILITKIKKMTFLNYVCYFDDKLIPYDIINIIL